MLGKASCNGSVVSDVASYFYCHFLNYVFGWGEQGDLALRLFLLLLFCFLLLGAWVVCFVFSLRNESLSQRENQSHLSLFQFQEGLECYCPPFRLKGGYKWW